MVPLKAGVLWGMREDRARMVPSGTPGEAAAGEASAPGGRRGGGTVASGPARTGGHGRTMSLLTRMILSLAVLWT